MNETCPHCGAQIYDPFGGSTRIHDVFECGRNKSVAVAVPATEETIETKAKDFVRQFSDELIKLPEDKIQHMIRILMLSYVQGHIAGASSLEQLAGMRKDMDMALEREKNLEGQVERLKGLVKEAFFVKDGTILWNEFEKENNLNSKT